MQRPGQRQDESTGGSGSRLRHRYVKFWATLAGLLAACEMVGGTNFGMDLADRAVRMVSGTNQKVGGTFLKVGGTNCVLAQGPLLQRNSSPSGSSSRELRREAVDAIPLPQLTREAQHRIVDVLDNTAMYRRLPVMEIEADPELFILLARYPEIVVEIWRLMGVSQMKCQRVGPYTVACDDAAGTISQVELVYGRDDLHLYHATGYYQGPMFHRRVDADCVLLLRNTPGRTPQGEPTMRCVLDVFIRLDNAFLNNAAKAMMPLVGRMADQNYVESLRFVERLNQTTQGNGPGVQGMAWRLEGLQPDVRDEFIRTAGAVYGRALQRTFPADGRGGPDQPMRQVSAAAAAPPPSVAAPPGPAVIRLGDTGVDR